MLEEAGARTFDDLHAIDIKTRLKEGYHHIRMPLDSRYLLKQTTGLFGERLKHLRLCMLFKHNH